MKIDIQHISEEYITPSSPTALHLRRHQLSSIDILQPPIYLPWIMFYPRDNENSEEKCDKIKKSLSEALTLFYPLAGRIKEDAYVDCNDQGAYFVQAKANCHLSDILDRKDPNELTNFAPVELYRNDSPLTVVQVTVFECGGLAIYLAMSHKVGDSASLFLFLDCWAAITRGDVQNITTPLFESATLFPPSKDTSWFDPESMDVDTDVVTKRFVFSAASVATLVKKYTKNGIRPTRFEALSAFLWSRLLAAYLPRDKPCGPTYAVNLRPRMDPTLPKNHFGNFVHVVGPTPRPYSQKDDDQELEDLVSKIREELNSVDPEYINDLQQESGSRNMDFYLKLLQRNAIEEVMLFLFTSLTSFPTHSADFGFGKPMWVAALPLPAKDTVTFFPDQNGDGMEAWLYLKEEYMANFVTDEEFLSYVTF